MNKKVETNRTKIRGGCLSGRKVVTHDSKSYLTLGTYFIFSIVKMKMKDKDYIAKMPFT